MGHEKTRGRAKSTSLALLTLALALALPAVVSATAPSWFPSLWQAPEDGKAGAGAGRLDNPRGIAVDPETGHLYVTEYGNVRISEFTAWGDFVKAWGWGVRDGKGELQTCTEETGCLQGVEGTGAGQLRGAGGIASDSSGDLYLSENKPEGQRNFRVQKFDPEGHFLAMWGGDVIVDGAAGSGTVTNGSTSITSVTTSEKVFKVGQRIEGTGIEPATTIASLGAGTITLSKAAGPAATGTTTALSVPAGPNNVPTNETQTVKLGANTTGGSFALTYTTPIPSNTSATASGIPAGASAAELEEKLKELANIGAGNVAVTGAAGGPWTVEFKGARYADTNVTQMSADPSGLTVSAGTKEATVTSANAAEVCSVAAECQAGGEGTANGQFSSSAVGSYIGVSPDGETVYVGDVGRIEEFSPNGAYKGSLESTILAGKTVSGLAVDPTSDNLYVAFSGKELVYRLSQTTGEKLATLEATVEGKVHPFKPTALAVGSEGDVFVVDAGYKSFENEQQVLEFDAAGNKLIPSKAEEEEHEAERKKKEEGKPYDDFKLHPFGAPPGENSLKEGQTILTALASSAACGLPGDDLYTGYVGDSGGSPLSYLRARGPSPDSEVCPREPTRSLTIAKAGTGAGTVKCEIDAGPPEACAASYPNGTSVKLSATAEAGSSFAGFSAGSGSASSCSTSPCTFTIEADSAVTATFEPEAPPVEEFPLTVTPEGTGTGKVTSSPAGIDCGAECTAEFEKEAAVTLTASPDSGSAFTSWKKCDTVEGRTCKVTISAARTVGAKFTKTYDVTVKKAEGNTGLGSISGAGSCNANCASTTVAVLEGKTATLKPKASKGSEFSGWTGCPEVIETVNCKVSAAATVEAEFSEIEKLKLTVNKSGGGQGTVKSLPAGINCGTTCSTQTSLFYKGTLVELIASVTEGKGSAFGGYSAASGSASGCSITPCLFAIEADSSLTAKFE
jgi:hypothetical protein